jgi:hypothetical protein
MPWEQQLVASGGCRGRSSSGAFALIREILDGRHGEHAHEAFARHVPTLGVPPDEAESIVRSVAKRSRA